MLVVGVDVGNRTAKAIALEDGEVKGQAIITISSGSEIAAATVVEKTLEPLGVKLKDVDCIVATGSGRAWTQGKESKSISFANYSRAAVSALAKWAKTVYPQTRTVIDVGSQTSTILRLDEEGRTRDIQMNDKCAAGAGIFFDSIAKRLKMSVEKMSEICLEAKDPVYITSMCTIFAEQELLSYFHKTPTPPLPDLIGGLYRAIAQRTSGLVRRVGVAEQVVMVGGVARNLGFVRVLEEELGVSIMVPEEPDMVIAHGAALLAADYINKNVSTI